MSEVLTVPTIFGDLSDLAQGLVDRVEEEQIVLYGPTAYEEGAELDFSLLLADGTAGLEGRGIVAASVDGGEERDPSTRYDIFIQALQFEGVQEVVFERMVMARQSMSEDEPVEEPVADFEEAVEAAAAAEEPPFAEEAPAEEAPAAEQGLDEDAFGGFDDEATVVAGAAHTEALAAALEAATPAVDEAPADEAPVQEAPAADAAADEAPVDEARFEAEAPNAEAAAAEEDAFAADAAVSGEQPLSGELSVSAEASDVPVDDAFDGFGDETPTDDAEAPSLTDSGSFSRPSEPSQLRSFTQPPPEHDPLRPAALDIELEKGAEPPEPPAPPSGFAIDNSLAEGLVRSHEVWAPVAPPPPEPRPSTGLFQYAAGPIPLPTTPPRPDLDPSLRVRRAPAPVDEGEAPAAVDAPVAAVYAASTDDHHAPRVDDEIDYEEDELLSDPLDLDSVSE